MREDHVAGRGANPDPAREDRSEYTAEPSPSLPVRQGLAADVSRLRPRLPQGSEPPIPFSGRLPVREHLRPKDGWRLAVEADVRPEVLAAYPKVLDELNACQMDVFVGPDSPGRGWDDWLSERVLLSAALAWPVEGEA